MSGHYWQTGTAAPQLPTWQETPRAVPPPLGDPPPATTPPSPTLFAAGPSAPVGWPWYQRWWVFGIAAFVVLALAAGVGAIVWLGRADRAPFDEAVTDLAAAPVLHYRADLGGTAFDVRVTGGGDIIGTLTVVGVKLDVLTMGGRTYVKAPASLGLGAGAGRWTTGGPLSVGATRWQRLGPLAMAGQLYIGLTEATFPSRFDCGERLDGQTVLKATLPDGDLYVTKAAPHRVVRFALRGGAPTGLPGLPKVPSLPTYPSRPALPSLLRGALLAELTAPLRAPGDSVGGDLSFDMEPVSPADYDKTFTDLRKGAGELGEAVDATVQFTLQGNANVSCSQAGCVVTANVANQILGTGQTKVTGAQVTAEMTASVVLNGRPAGSCVSPPTPVPVGGNGTLSSGTATAAAHRTGSRKATGCATRTPTSAWTPREARQQTARDCRSGTATDRPHSTS